MAAIRQQPAGISWSNRFSEKTDDRSFDEFHDERYRSVSILASMNLRDARMIERSEGLGLALEACQPLCVGRERFR